MYYDHWFLWFLTAISIKLLYFQEDCNYIFRFDVHNSNLFYWKYLSSLLQLVSKIYQKWWSKNCCTRSHKFPSKWQRPGSRYRATHHSNQSNQWCTGHPSISHSSSDYASAMNFNLVSRLGLDWQPRIISGRAAEPVNSTNCQIWSQLCSQPTTSTGST